MTWKSTEVVKFSQFLCTLTESEREQKHEVSQPCQHVVESSVMDAFFT